MDNTITISADKFCAVIFPDKLPEHSITKLRKIFTLMFRFCWENEEDIQSMDEYISEIVPAAKADLDRAVCEYRTDFISLERVSKKDAEAARAKNRKLSQAVGSAERRYERWLKIQSAWNAIKQKYVEKGIYYG